MYYQGKEVIDIKKAVKHFGVFNLVLLIGSVFLWISAIWVHGLVGALSWALLKQLSKKSHSNITEMFLWLRLLNPTQKDLYFACQRNKAVA